MQTPSEPTLRPTPEQPTPGRPLVALRCEVARLTGPPHLVEVGAVRVVDGEAQGHFRSFVRPPVPIDAEATRSHGTLDDDVRDAPTAREVLPEFFAWLGEARLAAHDAPRDATVLGFEAHRAGLEAPGAPFLDTLRLARRVLGDVREHDLELLADHLGLEPLSGHRALGRAVACWKVLEACLEREAREPAIASAPAAEGLAPTTIPGCGPRPPRTAARHRRLAEARRRGQPVLLHYVTDGETVARLGVLPGILWREGDRSYLEGECLRSGTLKTYRLDRIRRVEAFSRPG